MSSVDSPLAFSILVFRWPGAQSCPQPLTAPAGCPERRAQDGRHKATGAPGFINAIPVGLPNIVQSVHACTHTYTLPCGVALFRMCSAVCVVHVTSLCGSVHIQHNLTAICN